MVYIEDTRQQVGKHKNVREYFEARGDYVLRSKLLVGDYQRANKGDISVDTKSGVLELMQDVYKQHIRFRNELMTAQQAGIQLYVLVEETLPHGNLSDWVSPRFSYFGKNGGRKITMQSPAKLRKALETLEERYGVRFVFCDPQQAGEYVRRLLDGEHVSSGWRLAD